MKKLSVLLLILLMAACSGGDIPKDAKEATCNAGDEFRYIYKDKEVFEFYVNNELQDKSMLNIVQDAVNIFDSAEVYFESAFVGNACQYSVYQSTTKE